jgi:hypothetical protein
LKLNEYGVIIYKMKQAGTPPTPLFRKEGELVNIISWREYENRV